MDGRRATRFCLGAMSAVLLAATLAEAYLRAFPPSDLHLFLGEASPRSGNFSAHPAFRVGYADGAALVADNPKTLGPDAPLRQPTRTRPTWLVVGNSFGFNLASRLVETRTDRATCVFDRREKLPVRMAQIDAVASLGKTPDRTLLVVTPIDFLELGEFGLDALGVNAKGGDVVAPRRPPGVLGDLTASSRLALTAWVRSGRHRTHPSYRSRHSSSAVPESLRADVDRLFAGLAEVRERHGLALTVVVVPMRHDVVPKKGFAIDDCVVETCRAHGLDVVDPRSAFLAHAQPASLYIADGHLTPEGDDLVLAAVERSLRETPATPTSRRPEGPR